MTVDAGAVRAFLLERNRRPLTARFGDDLDAVPDSLDLHASGVIDSFGVLELVGALEDQYGVLIDFDEVEDNLLEIGALSAYIARKCRNGTAP